MRQWYEAAYDRTARNATREVRSHYLPQGEPDPSFDLWPVGDENYGRDGAADRGDRTASQYPGFDVLSVSKFRRHVI